MSTLPLPSLEHVFDVHVELGILQDHGVTRVGHRRVVPIVGGRITGEFAADIAPGGSDTQIVRPDGTVEVDGRYSAVTDAGDFVLLHVRGIRSGPPDVLESLLAGGKPSPSEYYFRTVLTLESSAPRLAHLQKSVYVTVNERTADAVRYAAYRVT